MAEMGRLQAKMREAGMVSALLLAAAVLGFDAVTCRCRAADAS
jgi:hypothetical protein